jgi:hypothetical protein
MHSWKSTILCCALIAGWACGSDQAAPVPTQPVPAGTAAPVKTPPQAGTAPSRRPSAAPSGGVAAPSGGAAAPSGSSAGSAPPAPMGKPEACAERRVSYSKPCSDDPDPCGINSGWSGDNYCQLPPPEGRGIQIHIGPKNYADAAEVAKYTIQSGEEFDNSVIAHIPLSENVWWNHMRAQLRPGSHHWIGTVVMGKPEERFYEDSGCDGAETSGSVGGGQNLIYDHPPQGIPAPENVGLGRQLVGNSSLCMNLHAYNFSDRPQLREMWINIYTVPEAEVTQKASGIAMVGGLGLNLAPGQNLEETYSGQFMADSRIIQLFGHRHAWTPHFAVWLNDNLIYDSWSWQDSVTFNYDSITTNPPIDPAGMVDGAVSGVVPVKSGDTLKFTCYVENKSDTTLRFSNQLFKGEMCNLWGSAVGGGVSGNFR